MGTGRLQMVEDSPEHAWKARASGFTMCRPLESTAAATCRSYVPDLISVIDDGVDPDDLLNLIIEVTGASKRDKEAKVTTAQTPWGPAVYNPGGLDRWDFIEITDSRDPANMIRSKFGREVLR